MIFFTLSGWVSLHRQWGTENSLLLNGFNFAKRSPSKSLEQEWLEPGSDCFHYFWLLIPYPVRHPALNQHEKRAQKEEKGIQFGISLTILKDSGVWIPMDSYRYENMFLVIIPFNILLSLSQKKIKSPPVSTSNSLKLSNNKEGWSLLCTMGSESSEHLVGAQ